MLAIAGERRAIAIGERAIVLDQAFECLPGQVQTIKVRVAPLERGHHAQSLRIVIETAERRQASIQRALAGMAKRRVAEVVSERQRLGQILIEPQPPRQRASNLGDFKRMGEARAIMVALVENENLGFVLEPAEGSGVNDAVTIAAKGASGLARRLGMQSAAAEFRIARIRCTGNTGFHLSAGGD